MRSYKRTELGKLTVEIEGNTVDLWIKDYNGDENLATVDRQELLDALESEVDDPATHPADCLCDSHPLEELLNRSQSYHIIEFRRGGWTIMHPLACRPDLFKCKVNRAAEVQITNAPKKLGRFRCDLTETGQFTVGEAEA